MRTKTIGQRVRQTVIVCAMAALPHISNATVVEFQTVLGNFEVNLYDNTTPDTVENFLEYVSNGRYTRSVFHRSVPGFIIQGGGFTFDMALPLDDIPAFDAVTNEPEFANVRGTIAMAKLRDAPNSATSQWFFNLADNTGNLDEQNGGFTVFGEVIDDGMDVVDKIAALPTFDFGGATQELPLQNFRQEDFDNDVPVGDNNLVIINKVQVTDSAVDSAAGLNPPLNTASQSPPPGGGSSGGGSLGFIGLLGLLLAVRRRVCAC